MSIPVSDVRDYFLDLQQRIVSRLELSDGKKFHTDQWDRDEGGVASHATWKVGIFLNEQPCCLVM